MRIGFADRNPAVQHSPASVSCAILFRNTGGGWHCSRNGGAANLLSSEYNRRECRGQPCRRNSVAQIEAVTATSNSFVPVIDIAPYLAGTPEGKRRVAAELDRACREVGFYIIVGHGVDPRLIEQIETVSREFFDLPLDEKMKVHIGNTA